MHWGEKHGLSGFSLGAPTAFYKYVVRLHNGLRELARTGLCM